MARINGKLRNQRRLTRSKGRNVIMTPNSYGNLPLSIGQMARLLVKQQPAWIEASPEFWVDMLNQHYNVLLSNVPTKIDRLKLKAVSRFISRLHSMSESDVEDVALQLSRVAPSSIRYIQRAREQQEHETRVCWLFWGLVAVLCFIIYKGATK